MVNKSGLFRKNTDSTHRVHIVLDVGPVGRLLIGADLEGKC